MQKSKNMNNEKISDLSKLLMKFMDEREGKSRRKRKWKFDDSNFIGLEQKNKAKCISILNDLKDLMSKATDEMSIEKKRMYFKNSLQLAKDFFSLLDDNFYKEIYESFARDIDIQDLSRDEFLEFLIVESELLLKSGLNPEIVEYLMLNLIHIYLNVQKQSLNTKIQSTSKFIKDFQIFIDNMTDKDTSIFSEVQWILLEGLGGLTIMLVNAYAIMGLPVITAISKGSGLGLLAKTWRKIKRIFWPPQF